jgi:hypothetical protein
MPIAHQPGSEPIEIPEQIPNPAVRPAAPPNPETRPERKDPAKVPDKVPAGRLLNVEQAAKYRTTPRLSKLDGLPELASKSAFGAGRLMRTLAGET